MEADMDDLELLNQYALTGSEDAFTALVSRYLDMVYSAALRRVSNPEGAREIAQAVFIILARKSKQLGRATILPAWLHQTTRLTAAHWVRTEMRRAHREKEACMQSLLVQSKPDVWEQVAPLLDDAIADLGEKDRNAVVLRFFQGKNFTEVGAALGASEDAAHKRVNRAVEKLRHYFVKRGISVSAGALTMAITANSVHAAPIGLSATIATTAALKGAAIAPPTLTLIKEILNIMAWTKLKVGILGGAALILAFGTGHTAATYLETKTTTVPQASIRPSVPSGGGTTNAARQPVFRWGNIESADYRQYIANMRAAGIPEPVIRDIVIADVSKNYAERVRGIVGPMETRPYWQKQQPYTEPDKNQTKRIMAVMQEETTVLEVLLGGIFSGQKLINQLVLQPDSLDDSVAWLPPDKRDAARRAFDEAHLADSETMAGRGPDGFTNRLALLKGVLSPTELEEYKLRESPLAQKIRQQVGRYVELSQEEFRAVVESREALGGKLDQVPAPFLAQTPESLREQFQILAKTVGEDRANEILQKSSQAYHWIRQAVESSNLPVEMADKALQLKVETEKAGAQILNNPNLSQTEREQQFNAIQEAARIGFVSCLGTNNDRIASLLLFDMNKRRNEIKPRP
jgi:RNA polymerase sigma factor (sigma-70 family)